MLAKPLRLAAVALASSVVALFIGCEKPPKKGACEVDYDDLGTKGEACTVVAEPDCKDDAQPPVMRLATSKKKTFTPDRTCKDIGYAKVCAKVPIAWTFKDQCPPGGQ